jgi:hypothetical protein
VENLFFRRAHLQRGLVILSVGLLQCMRALFGWAVYQVAWTWLGWVVGLTLAWRIYNTGTVWWALIEHPETWPESSTGSSQNR